MVKVSAVSSMGRDGCQRNVQNFVEKYDMQLKVTRSYLFGAP